MSTLVKFLVTGFFAFLLIGLAMANRSEVIISIPFFYDALPVPLAIVILNSVIAGFIWGAMIAWLNESGTRSTVRRQKREIKALEQEILKKDA